MARAALLDTNTVDLNDIFANGKLYRVPPYQRDYSWDIENWEDLWNDILSLENSSLQHYLGAIVLQRDGGGLTVIDGQQRLATLSLLALAALRHILDLRDAGLEADRNQERYDLLYRQFIGSKDPASLRYSSKLALNSTDDGFYQQYLIQFRQPANVRKLRESERLLWEAYQYFYEQIGARFGPGCTGEDLAEFLNALVGHRLIFIQIGVEDDLSAYTVFGTLNARGLELTEADLLKNFLLSKVSAAETDLNHARSQWGRLNLLIGPGDLPPFLRHYLNSRQRFVRRERLFKAIKEKIVSRSHVFLLLDELERAAHLYCALDDPNDEFWLDWPGCEEWVRALSLFRVTQYKPLALACGAKLDAEEFRKALRALAIVSFRFNIIGRRNTHELEQRYNEVACEIFKGTATCARDVIEGLRDVYVPDEEFRSDFGVFSVVSGSKKKLLSYILCGLENRLSGADLDYETASATVEHILPENPGEEWAGFAEDERRRFTYRLGNMTLLERGKNRDAANRSFVEKQAIYKTSQYRLTNGIDGEEWTASAIQARQREMAKWATAVWRID